MGNEAMSAINGHIAATLRALREARGWSLDRTAQATGVSKAMLGQIERGESSPTVATLWKIASGFEVSFSRFFPALTATTNGKGAPHAVASAAFNDPATGMNVTPLLPFDEQTGLEVLVVELEPGCQRVAVPHARGVIEHVIVIAGVLDVMIDGRWQTLQCGEAVRFAADRAHGYRNPGAARAIFHNLIHYPR